MNNACIPIREQNILLGKNLEDEIKDMIAERLTTGEKIPPEKQLMKEFGVSRTTLREVLSGFEASGLITSQQGSGRYVQMPDLSKPIVDTWSIVLRADTSMLLDLLEIRSILELNSLGKAIERCSVEQLTYMNTMVDTMMKMVDDHEAFRKADYGFHEIMFRSTGNRLLEQLLVAFNDLFIKANLDTSCQDYMKVARQHKNILESFAKQDLQLLTEQMKEHFADVRFKVAVSSTKNQQIW